LGRVTCHALTGSPAIPPRNAPQQPLAGQGVISPKRAPASGWTPRPVGRGSLFPRSGLPALTRARAIHGALVATPGRQDEARLPIVFEDSGQPSRLAEPAGWPREGRRARAVSGDRSWSGCPARSP